MSSKRPHVMDSAEIKSKRKRLCRNLKSHKINRIISPEIGSIYDILHDHATKSLYIAPVCWTDLHTQVLGCRFVSQPSLQRRPKKSVHLPPQLPIIVSSIGIRLSILMDPLSSRSIRNDALSDLLSILFPGRLCKTGLNIPLRCGKDIWVAWLPCQTLWNKFTEPHSFESATTRSSSSSETSSTKGLSDMPVLAYLDRHSFDSKRKHCFRHANKPGKPLNLPIQRLYEIRSRKLLPKNPDEDQVILAIMISMAQQHTYANVYKGKGFVPKDVHVRVITIDEAHDSFIVYTSVIPAAFLGMFHEPSKAPRGDAHVTIRYQRIPAWPVFGLREQLGQALGQDIVGDINMAPIETFSEQLLSSPQNKSSSFETNLRTSLHNPSHNGESMSSVPRRLTPPKRKREILSEVYNVSFSEDRESSDYPSELVVKRERIEQGRIGVVR
ncbi:hypothetical protein F4804DRAFT_321414 [Jackrogersella minutella]|nr:hypothetical protein F4804DRAFT_321414 [Jackrogersella minutella]